MNKNKILIIALLALALVLITPVSAETLTGRLGSEVTDVPVSYALVTGTNLGSVDSVVKLDFNTIQGFKGLTTVIHFDYTGKLWTFDAGAPTGTAGIPFIARNGSVDGEIVGTGSWGWQRNYNGVGTEIEGYQYFLFDTWTGSDTLTGNKKVWLVYNASDSYNATAYTGAFYAAVPGGKIGVTRGTNAAECFGLAGDYIFYSRDNVLNDYSISSPSGIGITGYILKSSGGLTYPSRAWVFNSTGAVLSNQPIVSNITLNFSVYSPDGVILGIQSPNLLTWYNTSVLFPAGGGPTPTPTITPVGPDNPIPAGYIRTMAQCRDGLSGGAIYGCNLQLMDVNNNSWSNVTGRADGLWWIDTLPAHTVDFYADATGYTSVSRTGLPVITGGITYDLVLWASDIPPAPAGQITLYIIVRNADYGTPLSGASIMVRDNTGTTQAQTTGTTGTRSFSVSNSSLVYVTVSKYGYIPRSRTVSTPVSGTDTETIELMPVAITTAPTSTIPPGGVTTAVTMDPRTASEKDRDMMDQIRDAGPTLIQLAIAATALGLLGLMMKSIK